MEDGFTYVFRFSDQVWVPMWEVSAADERSIPTVTVDDDEDRYLVDVIYDLIDTHRIIAIETEDFGGILYRDYHDTEHYRKVFFLNTKNCYLCSKEKSTSKIHPTSSVAWLPVCDGCKKACIDLEGDFEDEKVDSIVNEVSNSWKE